MVSVPSSDPRQHIASIQGDLSRSPTLALADFVASIRFDRLPREIVSKAKAHVLDGLGNQLAASVVSEQARIVQHLVHGWGGARESTVVGYGYQVPTPHAAMVNAMLGHGVELDDAHRDALTKAGSVLVATALAVAEKNGASGRELIGALVAGYEVTIRLGLCLNPSHRKRGFHTTGTAGTFGSAAVAARLLNLDSVQTAYAFGIAGMQAAGIQAFLDDPSMVKPLSPGKAAFNGILAALLAQGGFTGPRTILEGKEGFLRAFADEYDPARLVDGLGTLYRFREMGFKPHAACRYAHGPIDAMQSLAAEHQLGQLTTDALQSITVCCSELAVRQSGRVETPTVNSAMGSTPFGVALALLYGSNNLSDYLAGFEDDRVHRLAQKVTMVADPRMGVMGRAAEIRVDLRDGRTLRKYVEWPKGEPERPLSATELRTKFRELAGLAVDEERLSALAEQIDHLEESADVRPIMALTVR